MKKLAATRFCVLLLALSVSASAAAQNTPPRPSLSRLRLSRRHRSRRRRSSRRPMSPSAPISAANTRSRCARRKSASPKIPRIRRRWR